MDVYDDSFLNLWRTLNNTGVKYIMVGGFATNFHGYQRYTGDIDILIEDTVLNRQQLRKAFFDLGMGDYESMDSLQFIPGWVDFTLHNGVRLDILTSLEGVNISFNECLQISPVAEIEGIFVPFLHINQLIANKKKVNRPKDQIDVIELEKIRAILEERNGRV